jgi:DNA-binding response OmpR family regulator
METPKKILIIDDERDLSQMVKYQFKARGFEAETAADGIEGMAKVYDYKPDLIILDINMPRMGGIEFYNNICKNGKPLYPVLVLTARANIQDLFRQFDIDGFMVKPFEIDELVSEAELIIKKKLRKDKTVPQPGLRKICIVENDPKELTRISAPFLSADYMIDPAHSGTSGIERIRLDVPSVALVKLGLPDISGDMVILRLSQMSRTMDVKFILYAHRNHKHDKLVLEKIREKTGVLKFIEYDNPEELLELVDSLL